MAKAKEPTFTKPLTQIDLTRTLNWYNNNRTSNDARKYLHEYCKREIDSKLTISDISKWPYLATDGWVSRLLSDGVEFPIENMKGKHDASIKRYIRVSNAEVSESKPKPKIEDEIPINPTQRVDGTLGELEYEIDVFTQNDCKTQFSLAKYLDVKNTKQKIANDIKRWAKKEVKHYIEVLSPKAEKQLKEGYSNFSRPELKRLQKFYQSFYDDAEAHIKLSRKPRKTVKSNGGSETQASLEEHLTEL